MIIDELVLEVSCVHHLRYIIFLFSAKLSVSSGQTGATKIIIEIES